MNLRKKNIGQTAKRRIATLCAICLVFVGCNQSAVPQEIVTQKKTDSGRTPVTVLVKYAFTINGFEQAVESKFPDIDIIQVGNYTRDMGISEYARRLEHDDLTDIVMTWPLDVGKKYWSERLMDLSGYDFTGRYNISMLNNIATDGKLYYLPGPSQIRGIVYNKTLFEEKGWSVPDSFEGFLSLCKTIEESGMRSIQLGFGNSEVLDTAFVGYNYANYFSKPEDIQWISNYNNGCGSFGDHFSPALDMFQRMIDEGVWKASDLNVKYSTREKMIFSRQCAMAEDSVLMARMGYGSTGTTDEFALMPFFNQSADSDWARLYMVCYVGVNKHLEEPKNKKQLDSVLKVMDYISTPEGQMALSADTGAMFSSLIGVEPPTVPEVQPLVSALKHGRYAIFPELKNAQGALREGLAGMLRGDIGKQEVIDMVDAQNQSPPVASAPKLLGTATADFTIEETGSFVTDAMRNWSGCDVALFMDNGKDGLYNGKGISGKMYAGDVTDMDIICILPDLKLGEDGALWKVTMTGESLLRTLEYSIPINNNSIGWFYYFSGLKMTFDPLAEPGARVKSVTLADGSKLEPDKQYTVAVMDQTIPEDVILECDKTDMTIEQILNETVVAAGSISPVKDGRLTIV